MLKRADILVAVAIAVAVLLLLAAVRTKQAFAHVQVIASVQEEEAFSSGADAGAVVWFRDGIRALKRVSAVRVPSGQIVANSITAENSVKVEESRVWTDLLEPASDAILIPYSNAHSVAEVQVNPKHPYAEYWHSFDAQLLALKRSHADLDLRTLEAPIKALEQRAFLRVDVVEGGTTVYTLAPSFAEDTQPARAAYEIMHAVVMLRMCTVNAEHVQEIVAAVGDLEATKERNERMMADIAAQAHQDRLSLESHQLDTSRTAEAQARKQIKDVMSVEQGLKTAASSTGNTSARLAKQAQSLTSQNASRQEEIAQVRKEAGQLAEKVRSVADVRGGMAADLADINRRITKLDEMKRQDVEATKAAEHEKRMQADAAANATEYNDGVLSKYAASADEMSRGLDIMRSHRTASESLQAEKERGAAIDSELREVRKRLNKATKMNKEMTSRMSAEQAQLSKHKQARKGEGQTWAKYTSLNQLVDELDALDNSLPLLPDLPAAPPPKPAPAPKPAPNQPPKLFAGGFTNAFFEFGPGERVLDCDGGECNRSSKLVLWDKTGAGNQKFTYNKRTSRIESQGMCLDIADGNKKRGAPVRMWPCNNHNAQKWDIFKNQGRGQGGVQIRNVNSGKCLDVVGAKDNRGSGISVWDCNKQGHGWDVRLPPKFERHPSKKFKWQTQIGGTQYLDSKRPVAEAVQICEDRCASDNNCKGFVLYDPSRGNHKCHLFSHFGKLVSASDRETAAIKR